MIISTTDANGEAISISLERVHRAIELGLPQNVIIRVDDNARGAQRAISLADWHRLIEAAVNVLQVRVQELEQQA
jgi:hypothetical protein